MRERFAGPRWAALASQGARVQRPLWASTSTKNPAYRDVIYVEELVPVHRSLEEFFMEITDTDPTTGRTRS